MYVCVYVHLCVHARSQSGYYDLISIKSFKELITYSYICVCVHV